MTISKDIVEYTADLARLGLSEEEKTLFTGQLNDILSYIDVINSVDTKDISPTAHTRVAGMTADETPMRQDKAEQFKDTDLIINNAPEHEDNMFKVPKIMGEE